MNFRSEHPKPHFPSAAREPGARDAHPSAKTLARTPLRATTMAPWIRFIALRALAQDDELDAFQSLASW
jgi:hypothetical protein